MEYNFKLNESGAERSIILKNDMLLYVMDNSIYEIPYESIASVWLNKPGGICTPNSYSCTLNIVDSKPIFIESKNWNDNGLEIIQKNHYNSFVRVLHVHLKDKSKARYGFGVRPAKYALKVATILAIICLTTALSLVFELNNYLLAIPAILSVSVLTCGLNFCLKNFPSQYKPDHIPLTLLPVQS